jgi:hypothetical protein
MPPQTGSSDATAARVGKSDSVQDRRRRASIDVIPLPANTRGLVGRAAQSPSKANSRTFATRSSDEPPSRMNVTAADAGPPPAQATSPAASGSTLLRSARHHKGPGDSPARAFPVLCPITLARTSTYADPPRLCDTV